MEDVDELRRISVWNAHVLAGDRKGTWSLNVTRNWRLTFSVSKTDEVCDVDLEDYH
jgi:proteic killer suppression protein